MPSCKVTVNFTIMYISYSDSETVVIRCVILQCEQHTKMPAKADKIDELID